MGKLSRETPPPREGEPMGASTFQTYISFTVDSTYTSIMTSCIHVLMCLLLLLKKCVHMSTYVCAHVSTYVCFHKHQSRNACMILRSEQSKFFP